MLSPTNPAGSPLVLLTLGILVLAVVAIFFAWRATVRHPIPHDQPGRGESLKKPLVYAAIGASDVEGVGANDPSTESWINALHSMMPQGTRLVRLGRGGITLQEANGFEVPQAVAVRPDIVTLWNCVNDVNQGVALPDYLKQLEAALSSLTRQTSAAIVLLNLPDLTVLASEGDAHHRVLVQGGIRQWNDGMAAVAANYKGRVTIVDLFPVSEEVLLHPEYISADTFHPSTTGYKRLAELVWQIIEEQHLLDRR